jgi:hypothetical protein
MIDEVRHALIFLKQMSNNTLENSMRPRICLKFQIKSRFKRKIHRCRKTKKNILEDIQ